jgi:hypothetical protein
MTIKRTDRTRFMTDDKDAFDLWWEWAQKPLDSDLTIPADIHNAVMTLTPESRRDRAMVNAAVRDGTGPVRRADIYDGAAWTEMDIDDLKAAIEHGDSPEEAAEFLCRSGSIDDVARKARELGLKPKGRRPPVGSR